MAVVLLLHCRLESVAFTDAPLGQATAKPNLLDKAGPGGGAPLVTDSTSTIYAKLGSVVVIAGAVTWFGVPLLSFATEAALGVTEGGLQWLLGSAAVNASAVSVM